MRWTMPPIRRIMPVVGWAAPMMRRTVSAVVDDMVDMVYGAAPTIPAVGPASAQADAPGVVTPIPTRAPPTIIIPAVVVTDGGSVRLIILHFFASAERPLASAGGTSTNPPRRRLAHSFRELLDRNIVVVNRCCRPLVSCAQALAIICRCRSVQGEFEISVGELENAGRVADEEHACRVIDHAAAGRAKESLALSATTRKLFPALPVRRAFRSNRRPCHELARALHHWPPLFQ